MSGPFSLKYLIENIDLITNFEQKEIAEYFEFGIYFLGISPAEKERLNSLHPEISDGRGYYKVIVGDHIAYRFEVLRWIARGRFGDVVEVLDHKYNRIAIMKIASLYGNEFLANEIFQLMTLNKYSTTVLTCNHQLQVHEFFQFRGHFCVVQERLYRSLKREIFIQRKNFPIPIVKKITRSAFRGLSCIHNSHLIHGNIRTSNILLLNSESCKVKIVDFSYCHPVDQAFHGRSGSISQYRHTWEYCAPEIILQLGYSQGIDVWGMGCVIAELILGAPLFQGFDEADQMAAIVEVIGLPPPEMIASSRVGHLYFDHLGRSIYNSRGCSRGPPGSRILSNIFRDCEDADSLVGLIEQCLQWDPKSRFISKKAALRALVPPTTHDVFGAGFVSLISMLAFYYFFGYGIM